MDAYAVLQVVPSAHHSVIQAAYRALARHHHPDLADDAAIGGQMATINRAYEHVRTPERRAQYDADRARSERREEASPAVAPVAKSRFQRPTARDRGSRLDFGRYRGWSLADLAAHDPGYLTWLTRHSGGVRYRREIEHMMAAASAGRTHR